MELFEFKRYLGENVTASSERDNVDLSDYLEKLKLRKRKREESRQENETVLQTEIKPPESIDSSPLEYTSKKKKKKGNSKRSEDPLAEYLGRLKSRKAIRDGILNKSEENKDCISEDNIDLELKVKTAACNDSDDLNENESPHKRVKDKKENGCQVDARIETSGSGERTSDLHDEDNVSESPEGVKRKKKKKGKKKKNDEILEEASSNIVEVQEKKEERVVSFEVLGAHSFQDKVKVKRVLPRWLAEPTVISSELSSGSSIHDVGKLHRLFLQNLENMGVKELFPVQSIVIPHQLRCYQKIHYLWPRDLCVSAPTGSGKTLAYVLPILQAHFYLPKDSLYALVVVPVQELAWQVSTVFRDVAKGTGIKIGCVTGGTDMETESKSLVFNRDDETYSNLVHILVATPGRLMEHFFLTPGFSLKDLKFIVIDEADRVVEQKSLNWLHMIEKQCNPSFNGSSPPVTYYNLNKLNRGPQKLLFSATLSQDPEKLLKLNLFQPKLITSIANSKVYDEESKEHFCGKFTTPATLKEYYIKCDIYGKPLLIHKLLLNGWRRVLIFTKSCIEANRLCKILQILNENIKIEELTSLMVLGKRQSAIGNFSAGDIDILVCSDRMARGMDIKDVDYVIIYDPPKYAKGYIHRAGRTGRAGQAGTVLTVLTPKQSQGFLDMLRKAGKTDVEPLSINESSLDLIPEYEKAIDSLKTYIANQKCADINNIIKEKRTKIIDKLKKINFNSKF